LTNPYAPQQYGAPPAPPQQQWGQQAAYGAQAYVNQQQPPGWQGQPAAPPEAPPQAPPNASFDQDALNFADPTGGGGLSPNVRHWVGRTVILIPRRVDETAQYEGQSRPTAYFDLYICDGGPLPLGDSEARNAPRPPTHTVSAPAFYENAMAGNTGIVSEVRERIGKDGRPTALILGVCEQGTKGNRPFLLTKCAKKLDGQDRPDGAAREKNARDLYAAHRQGQWTPPKPTPLAQAGAPAGQGVVNYANAASPQQAAQWASANLDSVVQSQYGPGPSQAFGPPPAQQYAPAQSAPPVGMPPPPGWDPAQWSQFPPEQQQAIWAQMAAGQTAPAGAPTSGPGW
jgi:hypothetical protein